jgi:3-deoxy-D-manno-octulosonic-acid transferase
MAERLPLPLRAYRLASAVAGLFASKIIARRLKRGKEHPERFRERYGESKIERPVGPLVWVHAASVGELLAVIPLIGRIREREFNVLCTSGTVTSAALAEQRLPADVIHHSSHRRALREAVPQSLATRPCAVRQSELWPNPITTAARAACRSCW